MDHGTGLCDIPRLALATYWRLPAHARVKFSRFMVHRADELPPRVPLRASSQTLHLHLWLPTSQYNTRMYTAAATGTRYAAASMTPRS